jgi:hypothetical protein
MSMFDAQNLEHEIRKDSVAPTKAVVHEFPKQEQPSSTKLIPIQMIARDCTKLTWREAELMAKSIEVKQTEGVSLVHAIQSWAWEWKTFREEDQPGS